MDVYVRVSRLGERTEDEATELYETQCRDWADRNGVEVDEVVEETDVSGEVAVAERGLEHLVRRVESGESDGIIVPHIDRLGRDLIEGAQVCQRVAEAGGRLVAVGDGLDSASPGSEMTFHMLLAVAQGENSRKRANWQRAIDRAAEEGVYLASSAPFGYRRDAEGRLEPDPDEAPLVEELFRRRAAGTNYAQLRRWLVDRLPDLPEDPDPGTGEDRRRRTITKQGVRTIIANRAYVGEMRVQTGRKGHPRVKKASHNPLVSETEWNAAQIRPSFVPRNGTAARAELVGQVFCRTCGGRMKTGLSGPRDRRISSYVCMNPDCTGRSSIRTSKLDEHVTECLMQALDENEPHIVAVAMDDTRYQSALAEVEEARAALDEWKADVDLYREVGRDAYRDGIRKLKAKLKTAERALAETPPPDGVARPLDALPEDATQDQVWGAVHAERNRRYVQRVEVLPVGRGSRTPARDRTYVYWAGADQPYELAE
jgi:site-specific DNA recombinase